MRVLIAEDDTSLGAGLVDLLGRDGFECVLVGDGRAAEAAFRDDPFPIVVLDIVMPGQDGLTLCRTLRAIAPQTQIMLLSARGETFDKARGLQLGADDYVAKPFDPSEMRARVSAMARRARAVPAADARFRMGDLWIDPAALIAIRDGEEISLTQRELCLLQLLYTHAGQAVSRNQLFDHCWGRDYFPNSRALDQYISTLRGKIEWDPKQPCLIETVHGVGYCHPVSPAR